ncbi:PTS sugar transporter subunit IIB [Clostridium sp.]|uniref:PTS sugar transporter subunit IIB n=1 Tax=Clostridium sp. TaxID=1506 RepID=UPI00261C42E3|nr:PTS sugar transporter subunit IIB [uncultured Clostridium sp.]
MKRILVACGNGIATSTVVAIKIREACESESIKVYVDQCKLMELDSRANDFDFVVTTGKIQNSDKINVPIVGAMSMLTGIGEEETIEKIINMCKN